MRTFLGVIAVLALCSAAQAQEYGRPLPNAAPQFPVAGGWNAGVQMPVVPMPQMPQIIPFMQQGFNPPPQTFFNFGNGQTRVCQTYGQTVMCF